MQDYKSVNLYVALGVAVRELVTSAGPADYVLFVNRQLVPQDPGDEPASVLLARIRAEREAAGPRRRRS